MPTTATRLDDSVLDADGTRWVYRQTCAVLERRRWSSSVWFAVTGECFLRMTPAELRHVADVIEHRSEPATPDPS